jgi:hypothetical protein
MADMRTALSGGYADAYKDMIDPQGMAQNDPAQYYQKTPFMRSLWEGRLPTWLGQAYEQDIKPAWDAYEPKASDLYNAPMSMVGALGDDIANKTQSVMAANPNDPEALRRASQDSFDLAGYAAGGGFGASRLPGMVPDGAIGMFAGTRAKTVNPKALNLAKQMESAGASRDEIWKATGEQFGQPWMNDAKGGGWKFEIDDSGAAMRPDYANAATAKDAISHPEMFSAYPELGDVSFSAEPMKRNQGGVYHPRNHELSEPASMKINTNKTGDEATSISLHELGAHGVQDVEGFAKGGNLTSAYMDGALRKKWGEEIHKLLKPQTEAQFTKLLKASWPEATPQQLKNGYKSYAKDARKAQRDPYHPAAQAAQSTAAERLYLRQAGEAEARNVQTRMDYPMQQRIDEAPWTTLDVPEDELIYRMQDALTGNK